MEKKFKTIAAVGAVASGVALNMYRASKFAPEKRNSEPLPEERVNVERYAKNLQDAIKIKTISNVDESLVDWSTFDEFHKLLEERYPLVHKNLEKTEVGKASLVFKWQGKNPELDAIALLGHQDVVPVAEGTEDNWGHPPFAGEIADGFLWGRGALDMKNHLMAVIESVETLLEDGYEPERTVYLCFGHNEEIVASKSSGAEQISKYLESKGVHLDSVLDEGGAILPIDVPCIFNKNVCGVGVAEKGYVDFEISIPAKGGHSSAPPKHTALGELADVIKDIENNQFKSQITPLLDDLLKRLGKNGSFLVRNFFCNFDILKPVVKTVLTNIPAAASMIRTTTAVTMAQGSPASNVLPQKAAVTVNFRILPGSSIADVEAHLHKVIRNKHAEIKLLGGNEPSNVSPTDSRAFKAIEDIAYRMDNKNVVSPYLVMGGTDSRNYQNICNNIYRYAPFTMDPGLIMTTHGTNERIPVSCFGDGLAFFKRYIKTLASD